MKGRKRFIVTDTLGLLLAVHVVAANIQDRDGAKHPLLWTRLDRPGVQKIWAKFFERAQRSASRTSSSMSYRLLDLLYRLVEGRSKKEARE